MFLDARHIASGTTLEYDVCVVGSGPAGISLAMELRQPGIRVLVIEAGKMRSAGRSQQLYQGTVNDARVHLPLDQARARQFGGTSSLWGGRCMPFDAIDFEPRDHVPYSGWPISRPDLDQYYERAHTYCECGDFVYDAARALPDATRSMIGGFQDAALVTSTLERWSPPTHFGKKYHGEFKCSANVDVLTRALVLRIRLTSEGDRVDRLEAATLEGKRFGIKSQYVVLAAGGIETTRLLLVSNDVHRAGIGNHSSWLGRGYMSHLHGVVARVIFERQREVVFGYELDRAGVYCRRRLWLSEAAQKRHGLLNFYGVLDRPLLAEPAHGNAIFSLAFLAKMLTQRHSAEAQAQGKSVLYWAHIRNVLAGAPQVVSLLPKFSHKRFLHKRRLPSLLIKPLSNTYHLYFHAEQSPNPASRLILSDSDDAFGIPRLHLEFCISATDIDSVYRTHQLIDCELRAQGCGRVEFEREDPLAHIAASQVVLGHHLGTTRMAQTPSSGVVDRDCRVFGVTNLFVASASVFPTSSQANPTLTVVALAIRLADHLRRRLSSR